MNPVIIIDTREQEPLPLSMPSMRGTVYSGDYSISGGEEWFSVERKSIQDLVGSVIQGRERFVRELHRLRGYYFKRVLIVGSEEDILRHNYRSKANPDSVLHSIYAFEARYEVPFVWAANPRIAAEMVERWAKWFAYSMQKIVNEIRKGEARWEKSLRRQQP